MPKRNEAPRTLDARPDRVDYRDRMYQPKLVSLPKMYPEREFIWERLPEYRELVLDQGFEGACTGFGLAAVVNYLLWKKSLEQEARTKQKTPVEQVSPRMLYQMARFYDEWPGEDYSGSTCRGAMKGWFRHGVCRESLWPYRNENDEVVFVKPQKGWQQDAARNPLGAYYRVKKESITDMQSALCEVGALFVTGNVHEGWYALGKNRKIPPVIRLRAVTGGHAFAMVGYVPSGFIVQNSWGPSWGFNGFAILPYEDWAKNSMDAWAAVLGAPMEIEKSHPAAKARSRSTVGLVGIAAQPVSAPGKSKTVEQLDHGEAYQHAVVLGNNGHPLNRFLDVETAWQAVEDAALVMPLQWMRANKARRLAVFAQGGLTSEKDSIDRIRALAPYFKANGIYPLFITWRAGFKDTLAGLIDSAVTQYLIPSASMSQLGLDPTRTALSLGLDPDEPHALFAGMAQSQEARDQSVEVACQELMVKPVWMQMKRNAESSRHVRGALSEIVNNLQKLKYAVRDLDIHLIGHSAGAILIGHLLKAFTPKRLRIASCSLFAPACTVGFACRYFLPAIRKNVLQSRDLHIEILSNRREEEDSIGPYGKSLLYLVSRGMEDTYEMPILGMETTWDANLWSGQLEPRYKKDLRDWSRFFGNRLTPNVTGAKNFTVARGKKRVPVSHVDFDRDVGVITRTLERVRGRKLRVPVQDLDS